MKYQMIGCSHHTAPLELRQKLAFSTEQAREALIKFRQQFPQSEAVLLSTCNRVEVYFASEDPRGLPTFHDAVTLLAELHQLDPIHLFDELFQRTGDDAVRHLFNVTASLDSMVVGEGQILAQVKQAYELATQNQATGPLTHSAFQAAIRVAKRIAHETALGQKRVSIPSVAVADFAKQIFETFDDKQVLVIGAGEMGEETVRYLIDEGAKDITITNRTRERGERLAELLGAKTAPWGELPQLLTQADLVVSTTGATEPIFTLDDYRRIEPQRFQRPLFILDLAVPRDFAPEIGECLGVYLYCVDDLQKTCEANRAEREREWPKAQQIVEEEAAQFAGDLNHRATGPTIKQLKQQAEALKKEELARLLNKLGRLDPKVSEEIGRSFDRLINKLLHPPLESLRDEAKSGTPHGLLDALKRLFQLKD